jgi:hypothetical protein
MVTYSLSVSRVTTQLKHPAAKHIEPRPYSNTTATDQFDVRHCVQKGYLRLDQGVDAQVLMELLMMYRVEVVWFWKREEL